MFDNSKLYERLKSSETFLNFYSIIFLVTLSVRQVSCHACRKCTSSGFFGAIITMNTNFAAFVFSHNLNCPWDLSQRNNFQCNLWCCSFYIMPRNVPRLPLVAPTTFRWWRFFFFYIFFHALCWATFSVDDLDEKLGRNCVVTWDVPVHSWVEVQRFLGRLQIDHIQSIMIVPNVNVGLYFGSGYGSNGDTSEKYIDFQPLFQTSCFKSSCFFFLNRRFSRIQFYTDIVPVLFESLCEKTSIYQDYCLNDLVVLWCT